MSYEIIAKYFLLFMMYSFCGWCMETLLISIQNKRFVNRGFLIGPYCPIYGCGSLIIIIFLNKFAYSPIILFLMTILFCGILEYLTSWIMEVLFKARWWDYSNRKFNLNGRICLTNLIAFGVLGLIVIYVLNPFFINLLDKLQIKQLKYTAIGIAIIYLIDCIISFIVIFGFRKVTKTVNSERTADNTEQITKMVRELFSQKSFLHRRFINAYPRLEAIKIRIKEIKSKIEDVTNDAKDAVIEKTGEIKNKIETVTNDAKETINVKREEFRIGIERGTRKAKVKVYLGKRYMRTKFKGKIRRERE